MSTLTVINIVLATLLGAYVLYELVNWYMRKKSATVVDAQEFGKDLRRVQLVDVREKDDFKAGHILGARNIPSTQFKERFTELRKDIPIYLYDGGAVLAGRAAYRLKKNGYSNIFILKGGFESWTGKIKKG